MTVPIMMVMVVGIISVVMPVIVGIVMQSDPDPATTDKITDLRNMFQDAYTGWLEIYNEAA